MSLIQVEWACDWPLILTYCDGSVPAGFPSPAEDYLETPLDLSEYLIENKAATFMMRVDGDTSPNRCVGSASREARDASPRCTTRPPRP